jgi:NRAMP (natural resistance-associated macrophage protein)-like metal ion transporter
MSVSAEPLQRVLENEGNPIRRFLRTLGPGLITGASDDDPSGIATYAQAGAALGYAPLWTALITFPLMWAVQYICAKIAMVTGRGIAGVLRQHYSKSLLYPIVGSLAVANTINAGVDIGAIAAAINLLLPVPMAPMVVAIAAIILILQVWGSYRLIASIFKWLSIALLGYIIAAFFAAPHWHEVLRGTLVPTVHGDRHFLTILVAILGTTITPYLFFWQANQEVEEEISMGRRTLAQRRGATRIELIFANWDVATGMLFSNVVMYFIILTSAATLHTTGQTDIQSATEAAEALRPLAGKGAYILFAVGLIATGFMTVPILTGSAAYAIAEALGLRHGMDERPQHAKLFYGVIALSTLLGILINFLGISPMTALVWTAVVNGLLAPPLLIVVMLIANNRKILGNKVNGFIANLAGWAATTMMLVAAVALLWTWAE